MALSIPPPRVKKLLPDRMEIKKFDPVARVNGEISYRGLLRERPEVRVVRARKIMTPKGRFSMRC